MGLRLCLVRVKAFPEKKMFSCVWLHFKKNFGKYFLMFGCILENTIKNTFSTYCSHFLTFSRLPNEYIISFISQNTNKTQKKNHQIRTNEGKIAIGAIVIGEVGASRDRAKIDTSREDRSVNRDPCYRASQWCRDRFFLSPSLSLSLSLSLLFSKAGSNLKWK